MNDFKEAVSSTLRSLRAERHLTQAYVSDKSGTDIMTIGRYENNPNTIVLNVLEKIISVYGVNCLIFFELVNAKMHNNQENN